MERLSSRERRRGALYRMDFDPTPEQAALRERVEAFCRRHCTDADAALLDQRPNAPDGLYHALAEAGLIGYCLPAAHGGGGGGPVEACIINEVLARSSATATLLFQVNALSAAPIVLGGTDAQKEAHVRPVAEGRLRLAFALTEPNAGSDAGALEACAVRDGDTYVLRGTKLYTTGAQEADHIVTVVRTRNEGKASQGTSIFVVPRTAPGLTVTPLEKIAGNAVASCRVEYRDVPVEARQLVGPEHGAWSLLMLAAGLERLAVAAAAVGLADAVLAEVTAHVTTREQFGQPVSRFQAIQHQLADMATEIEAMRLLTYHAAWLTAQGRIRPREISMAKLYASERLPEIVTRGMRLLGGRAYFTDSAMPRRLREALLTVYAGGTAEIQRNVVARSLGL